MGYSLSQGLMISKTILGFLGFDLRLDSQLAVSELNPRILDS
jgi:hypothetical protein